MPRSPRRPPTSSFVIRISSFRAPQRGFTLVELILSMAILTILMLVTLAMVNQTRTLFTNTTGKVLAFRESRSAFEAMTRRISQASLNTYFDYVDAGGETRKQVEDDGRTFVPSKYVRQSELHFVAGQSSKLLADVSVTGNKQRPAHSMFFQAMLGFSEAPSTGDAQLANLLNAVGYYIEYSSDAGYRPAFLGTAVAEKSRYRLMQMVQSTEALSIYAQSMTAANRFDWFANALDTNALLGRPIAENIVAAVFWAKRSEQDDTAAAPLTTDYNYDTKGYLDGGDVISRNQLPPFVQVTLVAIDEVSAQRLEANYPDGSAQLLKKDALFTNPSDYEEDLGKLTEFLQNERLNYRVFSTNVLIRQAKFSAN